jgi:hypothetical protein
MAFMTPVSSSRLRNRIHDRMRTDGQASTFVRMIREALRKGMRST